MPDSDHRPKLTLEDLLHLKRAERPTPEFWTRFESELRQKQLAALIDRRPWWQMLPQLLVQRRAILPLGATAVIAFTLVSVNFRAPSSSPQIAPGNSAATVAPAPLAAVAIASPVLGQPEAKVMAPATAKTDVPVSPVQVAEVPLSANLPERASELTPWSAPRQTQSPAGKFFAVNVGQPDRADSHIVKVLVNNTVVPAANRVQRSGGAGAELASVSALASKRTRLLAQFSDRQFTPEPQAPALVRERLTRRLADATNVSDHFTRVGLKGDQVSLKF